jgi:hypothetical protein
MSTTETPPKAWTPGFDMSSIPDDVFQSERSRRIAKLRHSYTGGIYWAKHNPDTNKCRCVKCMARREQERAMKKIALRVIRKAREKAAK